MTLGEKILENRKRIGLSQEELGNELNVTRQSVSLWETNQAQPSLDNLVSLTKLFNISMDELCGNAIAEKIESEKKEYLFKISTTYNPVIYEHAYKKYYKKGEIGLIVGIVFSFFLLLAILISNTNQVYLIVPIFFLIISGSLIIKIEMNIKKMIKNEVSSKPNLVTDYYFYNDHIEIESHSDNSKSSYNKKYNEFTRISQDYNYIFLEFDGVFSVIDKNKCQDNLNQINQLLNIKQPYSKNRNIIRTLLLIMFVLSILSIFISLITVAISVTSSPLPEFPLSMAEHMWKFFLFTPLPLSSLVLGIIFIKRGYKCFKNIIAGIIMTFLLCIYGSFTSLFSDRISHDYSYIANISEKTKIDIPNAKYVSIAYDYQPNCALIAMVKFTESENSEFINEITQNTNWKSDTSYIPSNAVDLYTLTATSNYEYFIVYNTTSEKYNDFYGNIIYMAYDVDNFILYIAEYK